eukprot:1158056-Pelagomonas_calceolata.AAC.1
MVKAQNARLEYRLRCCEPANHDTLTLPVLDAAAASAAGMPLPGLGPPRGVPGAAPGSAAVAPAAPVRALPAAWRGCCACTHGGNACASAKCKRVCSLVCASCRSWGFLGVRLEIRANDNSPWQTS